MDSSTPMFHTSQALHTLVCTHLTFFPNVPHLSSHNGNISLLVYWDCYWGWTTILHEHSCNVQVSLSYFSLHVVSLDIDVLLVFGWICSFALVNVELFSSRTCPRTERQCLRDIFPLIVNTNCSYQNAQTMYSSSETFYWSYSVIRDLFKVLIWINKKFITMHRLKRKETWTHRTEFSFSLIWFSIMYRRYTAYTYHFNFLVNNSTIRTEPKICITPGDGLPLPYTVLMKSALTEFLLWYPKKAPMGHLVLVKEG